LESQRDYQLKRTMISSNSLHDVRQISRENLPHLLKCLDPSAHLVVTPDQATMIRNRLISIWPLPELWIGAYEQHSLQVLQERLSAPTWQMHAPDGSIICSGGEPAVATLEKPYLAVVSPLPPERSGISYYTAELLTALDKHYNLILIHPDASKVKQFLDSRGIKVPIRPPKWLDGELPSPLRIIYHFGNSPYHAHMLQLILRHPGIVMLHDYYLSHLINGWCRFNPKTPRLEALLYQYHGYRALKEFSRERSKGSKAYLWNYCLNQSVLQAARGVLVHSSHSLSLARRDYQETSIQKWHKVPMLSRPNKEVSETIITSVQTQFGLNKSTKFICSFGFIAPSKLTMELVEAFALSGLASKNWRLILAGSEGGNNIYRKKIEKKINKAGLQKEIHISGWVNENIYAALQHLSEINVQLRTRTRGETSAAVMDCLQNRGALIVNSHGSLKDLPDNACIKLPDHFNSEELSNALVKLATDTSLRRQLANHAKRLCIENHNTETCADAHRKAIEEIYKQPGHPLDVVKTVANNQSYQNLKQTEKISLINDLAARLPAQPAKKRLYVDVSSLAETDLNAGIKRDITNICNELLNQLPTSWILEPVQANVEIEGYQTAPQYFEKIFSIPTKLLPVAEPVLPNKGDLFLVLALQQGVVEAQENWYRVIRARGTKLWFMGYKLLPCLRPDCIPPGTDAMSEKLPDSVKQASSKLSISQSIAVDMENWLKEKWLYRVDDPTTIKKTNVIMAGKQVRRGSQMLGTIFLRKGWRILPDTKKFSLAEKKKIQSEKVKCYTKLLRWIYDRTNIKFLREFQKTRKVFMTSHGERLSIQLVEARLNETDITALNHPAIREFLGNDAENSNTIILKEWVREWNQKNDFRKQAKKSIAEFNWKEICKQVIEALEIQEENQ